MIIFTDSTGRQMTIARGTVIAVAAVIIAVAVAFYVLRGLGLYKLAKKHDVKYPFLAWIPFAWFYIVCMLVGGVALFGRRFEKFALAAFIVCTVAGVFYAAIEIIDYYPIVGYYLQGGDIEFLSTSSGTQIKLYGFVDPYSDGFKNALAILFYFGRILNIISIFFTVIVYSNFFRSFLPNHYFIATIFSIFGLFGPWAFVVRNNEKVNYADYMRARYAAFYGVNRGYGGTPTPPPSSEKNDVDPFENMDGKKDRGNDDPFGEFSDDKKD